MRGFAVIDAQPDTTNCAVWLTSRTGPAMVEHTNAVALDQTAGDFTSTLDNLLTRRHVLLTPDSDVGTMLAARFDDLTLFSDATAALHAHILTAIAAYKRKMRNTNLAIPDMPPARPYAPATDDTPTGRALTTANHLRRLWRDWLEMERERLRRTTHPRTGETPWMMPEELNMPNVRALPADIEALFAVEAVG